jgi:hypothetical protein
MPMKAVSALQKNAAANRDIRNNIKYKLLMLSIGDPADCSTRQLNTIITLTTRGVKELAAIDHFAFTSCKRYHHH